MLIQFTFVIKYLNGDEAKVTTRPATDLAYEEKFGKTIAAMTANVPLELRHVNGAPTDEQAAAAMRWFSTSLSDRETYFLAWHATRATEPIEDWIETVASIGWDLGGGSVDPTQPAAPAGS